MKWEDVFIYVEFLRSSSIDSSGLGKLGKAGWFSLAKSGCAAFGKRLLLLIALLLPYATVQFILEVTFVAMSTFPLQRRVVYPGVQKALPSITCTHQRFLTTRKRTTMITHHHLGY